MNKGLTAVQFTADLWDSVAGIRHEMLNSKFLQELAKGILNPDDFSDFIAQDMLYLRQDNEALLLLAERSPVKKYALFFGKLAEDGINSEKIMHDEYVPLYNFKPATEQTPAFRDYGHFILKHAADSPYHVAVAALLPCFWLYAYIGYKIYSVTTPDNRYMRFIQAYASPLFNNLVREYIEITGELSQVVNSGARALMKRAFIEASENELRVFKDVSV